jgi:hypothetical protein
MPIESPLMSPIGWCWVNRRFRNLTKFTAEVELPKPDSLVWQIGQSDFVRELTTKPIQLTSMHFINKSKV